MRKQLRRQMDRTGSPVLDVMYRCPGCFFKTMHISGEPIIHYYFGVITLFVASHSIEDLREEDYYVPWDMAIGHLHSTVTLPL
jgi:hypothetical protein